MLRALRQLTIAVLVQEQTATTTVPEPGSVGLLVAGLPRVSLIGLR